MTAILHSRVEKIVTDVAPMLGMHGGSIELVEITPENIVKLRFKGACVGCSAADMTLEYGLKEMIMIQVEEVEDVVAVNDEEITHEPPMTPLY
ncbi:MAG: nitrogen fixation protein NifU [Patescibacteria group bacterium]|jgi:Fe-S cluster biogenesis protein NfuA|nr:nitrogen fixation protein NifU [Patescibacteria group bacterium]